MQAAGIICEYNPFHAGHALHLEQTRTLSGCDVVLCAMSGPVTQRGEFACAAPMARAEAALRSGADVVVQIPSPYAMSRAELFARAGVSILATLGAQTLSFGSERADSSALMRAASILNDAAFQKQVATACTGQGISFAAARERLLEQTQPTLKGLLRTPNDILGVEYCRAILDQNLSISPLAIKRAGAGHDRVDNAFPSGLQLRAALQRESLNCFFDLLPIQSAKTLCLEQQQGRFPLRTEALFDATLLRLRSMSEAVLAALPDVSEGLEHRIKQAADKANTLSELIDHCVTRRYPAARIRRIALAALLGLTNELQQLPVPYVRLLGTTPRGRAYLATRRKEMQFPLIHKPGQLRTLEDRAQAQAAFEGRVCGAFSLLFPEPAQRNAALLLRQSPLQIESEDSK